MYSESKDIFKQLETVLAENGILREQNKEYKRKIKVLEYDNARLKVQVDFQTKQIEKQAKQISELVAQNVLQSKLIEKLADEVDRLRKQINTDSSNSSLPPSQDQKANKVFNSREKSGKSSGGQPGHKAHFFE